MSNKIEIIKVNRHMYPIDVAPATMGGVGLGIMINEFISNPHAVDAVSMIIPLLIFAASVWYPKFVRKDYKSLLIKYPKK